MKTKFDRHTYAVIGTIAFHLFLLVIVVSLRLETPGNTASKRQISISFVNEKNDAENSATQKTSDKKNENKDNKKNKTTQKNTYLADNDAQENEKKQKYYAEISDTLNIAENISDSLDFAHDSLYLVLTNGLIDSSEYISPKYPRKKIESITIQLEGRKLIDNLKKPSIIFKDSGIIVVIVKVDLDGFVRSCSIAETSTIENDSLRRAVLLAAAQTKFDESVSFMQTGRIIYRFPLQ